MKRVFIIHCWDGRPNYCWYPWVKKELEKNGFQVVVPAMPETETPKMDKWVPELRKLVGSPDKNTYLVGHSVGCITILRYLESLEKIEKIGGAILVAGFTDDLGYKEIKNFFETPIDFEKIKSHCENFIAIHSDNDPYVPLKHGDIFKEKLNAKLIVKHKMGHFSGPIDKKNSCIELPDVVEEALKIKK